MRLASVFILTMLLPMLSCSHKTVIVASTARPVLVRRGDKDAAMKVASMIKEQIGVYIDDKENYPYEIGLVKQIQSDLDDLDIESSHLDRDIENLKADFYALYLEDQYVEHIYKKDNTL